MSWTDLLPVTRGELKTLWSYVLDQSEHLTTIGEVIMAKVDELRDRFNVATSDIARKLDELRARVAEQDENLARELEPMVKQLEAMGQDPADPVPGSQN